MHVCLCIVQPQLYFVAFCSTVHFNNVGTGIFGRYHLGDCRGYLCRRVGSTSRVLASVRIVIKYDVCRLTVQFDAVLYGRFRPVGIFNAVHIVFTWVERESVLREAVDYDLRNRCPGNVFELRIKPLVVEVEVHVHFSVVQPHLYFISLVGTFDFHDLCSRITAFYRLGDVWVIPKVVVVLIVVFTCGHNRGEQ